jgi:hypothetical protein
MDTPRFTRNGIELSSDYLMRLTQLRREAERLERKCADAARRGARTAHGEYMYAQAAREAREDYDRELAAGDAVADLESELATARAVELCERTFARTALNLELKWFAGDFAAYSWSNMFTRLYVSSRSL